MYQIEIYLAMVKRQAVEPLFLALYENVYTVQSFNHDMMEM